MSESVRIGGIGKNPAIDRVNSLNAADVKKRAVSKMEQILLMEQLSDDMKYAKKVFIDFSKVNWRGKTHGSTSHGK